LALAIAARVLHREVKLDPLLLRGVVKVALEKILEESGTVLRVPMEDLAAWQELMEGEDAATVEVSGDARLARGECVLETRVGKVELGVEAQLEEIEKGFFDLLQRRPT
jgi:flagellar assembly protein FliH